MIATMAACLLVVWTALTQDDTHRTLAEQLGAEDPAARERAEIELLRIGEPARRAIAEAAARGSDEVKARASRLLSQLPLREALGADAGVDFVRARPGLPRVDAIVAHRARLENVRLDREAGLRLADAVLEGFEWRERYDDASHQKELFELGERVKKSGVRALSWIHVRLLEHKHAYVRLHAVLGLREAGAREHVDLVAAQIDSDKDEWLRRYAALATAELGGEAHRPRIEKLTTSPDRKDRENGYEALRILGGPASVAFLERGLADAWPGIRAHCALHLDEAQSKASLPALREALAAERDANARLTLTNAIRSLDALRGRRVPVTSAPTWSGPESRIPKRAYLLIRTPEEWTAVWKRHSDAEPPPALDFSKQMAVAIFQGDGWNSNGVTLHALEEDDATIRLRYDEATYQSMGGGSRVRAFGIFALPRSDKPVVIEENAASLIGQAAVWAERAVLR